LIDPLDEIIRIEGGQVLATLIRLTGDIDRAEDALHDAVVVAADTWRRDGTPDKLNDFDEARIDRFIEAYIGIDHHKKEGKKQPADSGQAAQKVPDAKPQP